jgi:di/tricarboxylate transporter
VAAVARRDEAKQREAALRPWLLWAVLVAGVAGLALMVWRLARTSARQA